MNQTIVIAVTTMIDAIESLAIANRVYTHGINVLNGDYDNLQLLKSEREHLQGLVSKYGIKLPEVEIDETYDPEFVSDIYCDLGSGFDNLATAIMVHEIQDWYRVDFEEAMTLIEIATRGNQVTLEREAVEQKMIEFVLDSFRK